MASREELTRLLELKEQALWIPQKGRQLEGYLSQADVLLFGGGAGGGKSDLAIGLALTRHQRSIIFRREAPQLSALTDRIGDILGSREGFNQTRNVWRLPDNRVTEFGSVPYSGDESRYQGRPHDLIVFDEAANFLESQVRFLMGWLRTTTKGQRKRVLLTSNPPTTSEGQWIKRMFAAWLDPLHPNPAKAGELRWYASIDGVETEVKNGSEFVHNGEVIRPQSRSFIPSLVQDNKYLMQTGYLQSLQNLPEPLRSQMLLGDFSAGAGDDEWQVIPSAWVKEAQARWLPPKERKDKTLACVGVDPSRGGADSTVVALRSGWYFDLHEWDGRDMTSGAAVADKVLQLLNNSNNPQADVFVDVVGIGASAVDFLESYIGQQVVGLNGTAGSSERDYSGNLTFVNKRAEMWWRFRELLDPTTPLKICLPPSQQLLAELCAPRYRLTAQGIQLEQKADIKARLGGSPDRAEAIIYASQRETPRSTFRVLRSV